MIENEKLPLGDMNWLELRRINDKLKKLMGMMPHERKIIEFILCRKEGTKTLNALINTLLKKGYEVYGNPFSDGDSDEVALCQAVVKYE